MIFCLAREGSMPMKKLYRKDEIWFAVLWIAVYVVGFSLADALSEVMGFPKLVTCAVGTLLSAVLAVFLKTNDLTEHFGLCRPKGERKRVLLYIPLIAISSVDLWNGLEVRVPLSQILTHIISMAFVAFLEELIFRGLLFQGMRKNVRLPVAVAVSSLTFGMGHIINLLTGAPLGDTLLQLMYASAVGFCFTALFLTTGSIVPCILAHGAVNCMSIFAIEPGPAGKLITALIQTALGLGYGFWLLRHEE